MTDITALPGSTESFYKAIRRSETFKTILVHPWSYATGAVLLALLAGSLLESTGKAWGVTTSLTYWGAWAWQLAGGEPHSWAYFKDVYPGFNAPNFNFFNDTGTLIDLGLVFGALAATLLSSQFKIKRLKSNRQIAAAILGGLLMGFGARLSFGCNIGGMFSAVPAMSLNGWVFLLFIFIGAMVGSKLLVTFFIGDSVPVTVVSQTPSMAAPAIAGSPGGIKRIQRTRVERKENVIQFPLGLVLVFALGLIAYYYIDVLKAPRLGVFWVLGIALGFTLQRSRFCFTAAMRDPCLTGGTNLTKAVIIGLAVATVIFSGLQLGSYLTAGNFNAAVKIGNVDPVGLHTAAGAFLFGIGAVISGGCATGTLMRMGEGFVQQWIVLPFFCIGGTIAAAAWPIWSDLLMVDMKSAVYLPKVFGGFMPALLIQFAALFALYLLADWWSKHRSA
jgi:uncharacterized membrane protein YedE/YeeE